MVVKSGLVGLLRVRRIGRTLGERYGMKTFFTSYFNFTSFLTGTGSGGVTCSWQHRRSHRSRDRSGTVHPHFSLSLLLSRPLSLARALSRFLALTLPFSRSHSPTLPLSHSQVLSFLRALSFSLAGSSACSLSCSLALAACGDDLAAAAKPHTLTAVLFGVRGQLLSEWLEVRPRHILARFLGYEDKAGPSEGDGAASFIQCNQVRITKDTLPSSAPMKR